MRRLLILIIIIILLGFGICRSQSFVSYVWEQKSKYGDTLTKSQPIKKDTVKTKIFKKR